ncbi:MAG: ABC transporter permease [Chloroflexota bacterium]|nr:MAG: ABC transporter permease [Chloroflexota bacterium]
MLAYILRRSLFLLPLLLVGSMLVFLLLRVAPGDPAAIVLGPEASPQEIETLRQHLGLNDPLPIQYLTWLRNVVTGNLGNSIISNQPIGPQIIARLPVTLEIWFLTLVFGTVFGVSGGILSAVFRDSFVDYAVRLFTVVTLSVPAFFALTLLIVLPSLWWNYVPPLQYASPFEDPGTNARLFLPPILLLALEGSAALMRFTRSACIDVLHQDYIRTARSKGLAEIMVVSRHMFKNAVIPIVTIVGARLGAIVSGSVILEQVMSVNGLGQYIYQAILSKDYPVVQVMSLYIGTAIIISHLLVDVSYAYFDPRIRYQ